MTYNDLLEMLEGHSFLFTFNDDGETVIITTTDEYHIFNEWIKVHTIKKDGGIATEVYYPDGRKEQEK